MLLLPLVDHTIARGLCEPQSTGSIRIRTGIADEKVRLEIAGSGNAFLSESEGDDIAGIRERLASLYGGGASLELRCVVERVTEVIVEIPVETLTPPTDAAKTPVDARRLRPA